MSAGALLIIGKALLWFALPLGWALRECLVMRRLRREREGIAKDPSERVAMAPVDDRRRR